MRRLSLVLLALPLLFFASCGGDDDGTAADRPAVGGDPAGREAGDPVSTDDPAGPDGAGASGSGTGRLEADAGTYEFEPTRCSIVDGEVGIAGPGSAPDGRPFFLDLEIGEGFANFMINVGAEDMFDASPDDPDDLINGEFVEQQVSGSTLTATLDLSTGDLSDAGQATLEVTCG